MNEIAYKDYGFSDSDESHMYKHFMPHLLKFAYPLSKETRVLDVGCGNGAACGIFLKQGCQVVGVDLSEQGIAEARQAYPKGRFELIAADDNVLKKLNEIPFDFVISTEVVEHVYAPRDWARGCFNALKPGGKLICTTPYHGYLKTFFSLVGKWNQYANPPWDGGPY